MAILGEGHDELVDLTAREQVDVADTTPGQPWGQPGKCSECGGRGYLDHIDMIDRIMFQHCTECAHKWTTAQAETVTQKF